MPLSNAIIGSSDRSVNFVQGVGGGVALVLTVGREKTKVWPLSEGRG